MTIKRIGGENITTGSTGANQRATDSFRIVTEDGREAEVTFDSCAAPRWSGAELTDDERDEARELAGPLCVYCD